jgi:hypothetical protein
MKNIHTTLKLPKQWNRWFKKAGLKSTYSSSLGRRYGHAYFKGHGRNWRIDCNGYLDMSERFDDFDRWSNSLEASVPMDAKNEGEFIKLIERLLPPYERLVFQYRKRAVRINLKGLKRHWAKINLNKAYGRMGSRHADFIIALDSLSSHPVEHLHHMRMLKERSPGAQSLAMDIIRSFPAERAEAPAQVGTVRYDDSDLFHPLSDEAINTSRLMMTLTKGLSKGTLDVVCGAVGTGRSVFFSNPVPEHLKGMVVLPPMWRGEPGPSLEERLDELTRALGHEHLEELTKQSQELGLYDDPTIQQIANAANAGAIPEDHGWVCTGSAPGVSGRCDRPLSDPAPDSERFNLRREYRDAPLDVTTLGSGVREYIRP